MPRQIITLEQTSGLSDASPIHRFLKITDACLKKMDRQSWFQVHKRVPVIDLLLGIFHFMGHPITHRRVADQDLARFRRWLWDEGETELSVLCSLLGQKRLSANDIRLVMLFVVPNLGYLKDREERANARAHRSIDDDWHGVLPDTEWKAYLEGALQPPESQVE